MVMNPIVSDYDDQAAVDPAVRTPLTAGYVASRARFTRMPRTYRVAFNSMDVTARDWVKNFEIACAGGSESFTWVDPESTSHIVRFMGPVVFNPWSDTNYLRWSASFVLEEV